MSPRIVRVPLDESLPSVSDEQTPLLKKSTEKKAASPVVPSLWLAMLRQFGGHLLIAQLCKVVYDVLTFTSPLLLRLGSRAIWFVLN